MMTLWIHPLQFFYRTLKFVEQGSAFHLNGTLNGIVLVCIESHPHVSNIFEADKVSVHSAPNVPLSIPTMMVPKAFGWRDRCICPCVPRVPISWLVVSYTSNQFSGLLQRESSMWILVLAESRFGLVLLCSTVLSVVQTFRVGEFKQQSIG